MPSGLQIWDASGTLILDATTPTIKFLGILAIGQAYTGNAQSGSIVVNEWNNYSNPPFWARTDGGFDDMDATPVLSRTGNNLVWSFPLSTYRPNVVYVYGMR